MPGVTAVSETKESSIMQLTEQHVINKNDPRFAVIDAAAFASKNLYNAALFELRQVFIHQGIYYRCQAPRHRMPGLVKRSIQATERQQEQERD
jgi:hypothetical protein